MDLLREIGVGSIAVLKRCNELMMLKSQDKIKQPLYGTILETFQFQTINFKLLIFY